MSFKIRGSLYPSSNFPHSNILDNNSIVSNQEIDTNPVPLTKTLFRFHHPFLHALNCVCACVCVVLCSFTTYIESCLDHHCKDTDQFHHCKGMSSGCLFIITFPSLFSVSNPRQPLSYCPFLYLY